MNTIKVTNDRGGKPPPSRVGHIFKINNGLYYHYYILSRFLGFDGEFRYVAVDLCDGNRFCEPQAVESAALSAEGYKLEHVGEAFINIEVKA